MNTLQKYQKKDSKQNLFILFSLCRTNVLPVEGSQHPLSCSGDLAYLHIP